MTYPLVYYFKSKYCAPCKPIEKMLDEINISLFGNRLNVKKIDVAEEVDLARKFNVLSVPTVIIGRMRLSVVIDKNELTDAILQGFLSSVSFEEETAPQKVVSTSGDNSKTDLKTNQVGNSLSKETEIDKKSMEGNNEVKNGTSG